MKKYIVILFLVFIVTPSFAKASVLYSQPITLSPGWNIVSTPKVLESHMFSALETSNNFDIYALDASKTSGWATLADLGQTEFTPLYGYFINNKTGIEQILTFNYKDVEISEQFFSRTFPVSGWYSFGIANSTYAKSVNSDDTDTNNPDNILNSLIGSSVHYGDVVDFTDSNYNLNKDSVALADPWKDAVRSADIANNTEINTLNDFRETKGYAIYIKDANTEYSGLQNITIPQCSDGIDNDGDGFIDMADVGCSSSMDNIEYNVVPKLTVSKGISTPVEGNVEVSDTSSTSDILMLEFKLKADGSDMTFNSIDFDLGTSDNNLVDLLSELTLKEGPTELGNISSFLGGDGVYTITLNETHILYADSISTFRIYAKVNNIDGVNFNQGDALVVSFGNIDAEDELLNEAIEAGSANGANQYFYSEGISSSNFISGVPSVITNEGGVTTSASYPVSFKVTAIGNSFYIPKNGLASLNNNASFSNLSATNATEDGNYWLVEEGSPAIFTTTGLVVAAEATVPGFNKIILNTLSYDTDSTAGGELIYTFNPSSSYQTSSVYFSN